MAIIHVNRQFIAMNAKDGGNRPVYTIKRNHTGRAFYAHEVEINGPSRMVYSGKRLPCGARAWIECDWDHIRPVGGFVTFEEAKKYA